MDRETKTYTTPLGKQEIVVKAYLIGREKRLIENVFLQGGEGISVDGSGGVKGLKANVVDEAQNLAWRTIVISIDGKKDGENNFNVVDEILNMRASDYNFILKLVNAVTNDEDFTEKKSI